MTWLEELVEERTKALMEEFQTVGRWERPADQDESIARKFILETIKLVGRGIIENVVKDPS